MILSYEITATVELHIKKKEFMKALRKAEQLLEHCRQTGYRKGEAVALQSPGPTPIKYAGAQTNKTTSGRGSLGPMGRGSGRPGVGGAKPPRNKTIKQLLV